MLGQRLHIYMLGIRKGCRTNDVNVFKEIKAEVSAKCNIIQQFSTAPAMNAEKPY